MVRTLAEVHADRVTVTVTFDDAMSERLYTAAEVGDAQAGEAELVAKPLQRRIAELEYELNRRTIERDQRETARAGLERQVHLYDVDRKTEQRRADKNQVWAESAEKVAAKLRTELEISKKNEATALSQVAGAVRRAERAETALQQEQDQTHKLARNLGRVAGQVYSPALCAVLARDWKGWTESETSLILFAISAVRNIVGGPPTPPVKSETQA